MIRVFATIIVTYLYFALNGMFLKTILFNYLILFLQYYNTTTEAAIVKFTEYSNVNKGLNDPEDISHNELSSSILGPQIIKASIFVS